MSLGRYREKRNFSKTAEPAGRSNKKNGQSLIFVVQQHAASHLHYDFRLEMDGVLKSWAVPKGPSLNPRDKRLAMMVEDHPFDYKDFEGTIAEGNYGAGNVIVWDNGTYNDLEDDDKKTAEKKLLTDLKKGKLSFILNGSKLKGEFALVKLKGKDDNAWLLIKKEDKFARDTDVLKKNKSVISNKPLQLPSKKTKKERVISIKKKSKLLIPKPEDVDAMLSELRSDAFDDENWIFEIKHDGYRVLAITNGKGSADLFSRNHLSFNKAFPAIADELKRLNHAAVIDGEIVIEDDKGRSHFQLLQNYQRTGKGKLKYYVFDLLNLDGTDVRELPLRERKELLKMLLKRNRLKNIYYSEHVEKEGKKFFSKAVREKREGIMAKNASSPYRSGRRTKEWFKIKITQEEEAVIAGITAPKGGRTFFGSLLLGMYKNGRLKYIGNCGTGFTDAVLKELYRKFKPYFTKENPFSEKIPLAAQIQWIKPVFVCQVKFSEWTEAGQMRHPVYLGLRVDKDAAEVTEQNNSQMTDTQQAEYDLKIGKVSVHLTNQNKIYFPADNISKGQIVNYYLEMAHLMLPYLKDRPQSMNRYPNGINGESFYQKDVDTKKIPDWLKTESVFSDSNNKYIDYLICNDKATLAYMANLGCIEINPWNSRITAPEMPDWMVIDLDPEKIAFREVTRAAREVKKLLDELEADCYCKTSGATGLHIYIPLAAKYHYDVVKTFAQLIAQTVQVRLPSTTSIVRSPAKRQKKVYLDYLQNRRGQTLAAPYSVRPKPGATVSTPLEWSEVNEKLDPAQFTIKNILSRVEKKGDLWKPVTGKGINLNKILKKMQKE